MDAIHRQAGAPSPTVAGLTLRGALAPVIAMLTVCNGVALPDHFSIIEHDATTWRKADSSGGVFDAGGPELAAFAELGGDAVMRDGLLQAHGIRLFTSSKKFCSTVTWTGAFSPGGDSGSDMIRKRLPSSARSTFEIPV